MRIVLVGLAGAAASGTVAMAVAVTTGTAVAGGAVAWLAGGACTGNGGLRSSVVAGGPAKMIFVTPISGLRTSSG